MGTRRSTGGDLEGCDSAIVWLEPVIVKWLDGLGEEDGLLSLQSFFELILSRSTCLVSAVAASVLVLSVVTCARFNSAGINKSLHAGFVHGIKKVCAKCLGLLEHIDIAHLPGSLSLYRLDHIDKSLSE
ncbi:hypothetical protein WN943_029768 [Citrus x changshan-huyou]